MAIPEGWRILPILEVVDLPSGQVDPTSPPYRDWPLLAPNHIISGSGRWTQIETAEAQGAISGKYVFQRGDVVYSKIRPYLRKATVVNQAGLCSADMYPLRSRPDLVSEFLLATLLGDDFTKFATSVSARTGIPKINREELAEYRITLPPLPEQKKIAAILSSVDETIAKTESVIAQLQIVKKAMMEQLLTKGMPGRHTRFKQTEIGEIPEEWEVVPLGDLLDGIDAGWSPQCETRMAEPHEWGVLKVSAVSSGKYLETENKALPKELPPRPAAEVLPGDILLARANGVLELVGRTVFVHESRERLMLSDKIMRLRPSARIAGLFMHYSMNASTARDQILELTGGSHMRNISQDALRRVVLPVPSRSEQAEISSQLAAIELVTRCEDRTLSSVRSVKESLSSSLLSGEIRVIPEVA